MTSIDPWFLEQLRQVVAMRKRARRRNPGSVSTACRYAPGQARRHFRSRGWPICGTSTSWRCARGARSWASPRCSIAWILARRSSKASRLISIRATKSRSEAEPTANRKVMILGSGPNRIGQGIEFDYCCCHASFALQEFGIESIMVNCNPETVSTDYDTSDRLYFEPLTLEEVLNICDVEKPDGVIVQFGGQTPLNLALPLKSAGRADHRHRPAQYRSGRGSQAVRQAAGRTEDSVAAERDRYQRGRSLRGGAAHRLSGVGAAQLCAGRPRHGDRLRRGDGAAVHAGGGRRSRRTGRC